MSSIPIICMVCSASIKDTQFVTHMNSVHGGLSQPEAMIAEKNIPKQQAPIVLDKEAPPSDDFMEVAKMLDEKPKEVPPVIDTTPKVPARSMSHRQEERKPLPITLEYNYTGECPKCFVSLKTVIVHTAGKCFAVAICMNHGQLKEREVADLEEDNKQLQKAAQYIDEIRDNLSINRKGVKRGKRSKSVVQHKATVQSTMPVAGLPRN